MLWELLESWKRSVSSLQWTRIPFTIIHHTTTLLCLETGWILILDRFLFSIRRCKTVAYFHPLFFLALEDLYSKNLLSSIILRKGNISYYSIVPPPQCPSAPPFPLPPPLLQCSQKPHQWSMLHASFTTSINFLTRFLTYTGSLLHSALKKATIFPHYPLPWVLHHIFNCNKAKNSQKQILTK